MSGMKYKPIKTIHVKYRNKIFYWLRRFLPDRASLVVSKNGNWFSVDLYPGIKYEIRCKNIRILSLIQAIVFVVYITRD